MPSENLRKVYVAWSSESYFDCCVAVAAVAHYLEVVFFASVKLSGCARFLFPRLCRCGRGDGLESSELKYCRRVVGWNRVEDEGYGDTKCESSCRCCCYLVYDTYSDLTLGVLPLLSPVIFDTMMLCCVALMFTSCSRSKNSLWRSSATRTCNPKLDVRSRDSGMLDLSISALCPLRLRTSLDFWKVTLD